MVYFWTRFALALCLLGGVTCSLLLVEISIPLLTNKMTQLEKVFEKLLTDSRTIELSGTQIVEEALANQAVCSMLRCDCQTLVINDISGPLDLEPLSDAIKLVKLVFKGACRFPDNVSLANVPHSVETIEFHCQISRLEALVKRVHFLNPSQGKIPRGSFRETVEEIQINLENLEGLEECGNLRSLVLSRCGVKTFAELDGINGLVQLQSLTIQNSELQSIKGLELYGLSELRLPSNALEKIGGIEKFTNLKVLDLRNNQLRQGMSLLPPTLVELYVAMNRLDYGQKEFIDRLPGLKKTDSVQIGAPKDAFWDE